MAHESFEDSEIAQFMNDNFVNIKVDREERPDIDSIYMEATVALTGHGGWPMSVFLDHEGRPFFAGTYFPPQPHHGLPSFPQVLESISTTWNQSKESIESAGSRIIDALESRRPPMSYSDIASMDSTKLIEFLRGAVTTLSKSFDATNGGFEGAPKFPPSMILEFLIRMSTDESVGTNALHMASRTLEAMARGGIYDQLGGGFARYSVDGQWVVPHFEKMLYDNALLIRVYAHWWRLTGSKVAERIVHESINFLLSEMRTPEGAFAAALDADSDGEEGKFYAWTPAELIAVLGESEGTAAAALFQVTEHGTFEHGKSTLQLLNDPNDWTQWSDWRSLLFNARAQRVYPGRDDKVVAAWNGLTIAALADAGAIFGNEEWIEAARSAADLVISVHMGSDRRADYLARTSRDGKVGSSAGVLDDYANMSEGLISLYEATGESEWLELARTLAYSAVAHFADNSGGFYDTADDAQKLIRRPREFTDNAEPSGWFALANCLVRLSGLGGTNASEMRSLAESGLSVVPKFALSSPRAVGWGLVALWSLAQGPWELVISGPSSREFAGIGARSPLAPEILWEEGAESGAQVCKFSVCELPTKDPGVLAKFLKTRATL